VGLRLLQCVDIPTDATYRVKPPEVPLRNWHKSASPALFIVDDVAFIQASMACSLAKPLLAEEFGNAIISRRAAMCIA